MTRVVVPVALRPLTGGEEQVEVQARDVRGLVRALDRRFPGFARSLGDGFAVAIDGEILQDPWLEPVPEEGELHFLPALAGGC